MSEEQFYFECWLNCYTNQIDGYAFGDIARQSFKPIVPIFKNADGTYNRQRMIEGPAYTFSDEQKKLLLLNR